MADSLHICRSGIWRYADGVEVPVRIVAFEWDLLPIFEDEEEPLPRPEGLAYCVQVGHLPQYGHPTVFPSTVDETAQGPFARSARLLELDQYAMPRGAHTTEAEAVRDAEALLGAGLRWAPTAAAAP